MRVNLDSGCLEAIALVFEFISQIQARRNIINIVTKDVSKAFNKVWHEGPRFKIQTQYQLPPLTIKLLFNFLQQRAARIKVNDYEGPAFDLKSGVPQGSGV